MYVNSDNKYSSPAEYFYNNHIEMYCVVGTTLSAVYLDELVELFANPDLLTEVPMPEYITGPEYDESEW